MKKVFRIVFLAGGLMGLAHHAGAAALLQFQGHVLSVATDVNSVHVMRDDGQVSMYFTLDWRTKIHKNHKLIQVQDLQENDWVRVRYYANDDVPTLDVLTPKKSKAADAAPATN